MIACRFRRLVHRAPIPYCTLHDLRHTYGSTLAANGVKFTETQKRLGHKNLQVTLKFYIHATKHYDDKAEKVLDDLFDIF